MNGVRVIAAIQLSLGEKISDIYGLDRQRHSIPKVGKTEYH